MFAGVEVVVGSDAAGVDYIVTARPCPEVSILRSCFGILVGFGSYKIAYSAVDEKPADARKKRGTT